jgi:uncharacterized repeat protein (TIGR02543 family)
LPTTSGYTAPYTSCIRFGEYPQTHVSNTTLINNLNANSVATGHQYLTNLLPAVTETQTWAETLLPEYIFDGEKYVYMATSHAYGSSSSASMSTGTKTNTNNIWFKVEPLYWFVTGNDGMTLSLLAVNSIIAGIPFHNSTYPTGSSTYADSGIRAFLNGGTATNPDITVDGSKSFFRTAFNTTVQGLINSVTVENNSDYYDNGDTDDTDTIDKIWLPSYKDMVALPFSNSGNSGDIRRIARLTDFALANFATGPSWLRSAYWSSPSAGYKAAVWAVDNSGIINYEDNTKSSAYSNRGIRPAMQISIPALAAVGSVETLTRGLVSYSYSLNGASGTPPAGGAVMVGKTITLPDASLAGSRADYIFSGWGVNNGASVTHNPGATVAINATTTIYAIWTPANYSVGYNLGGGSWVSSPPTTYNAINGLVLPTSAQIIRSGYTFLRWHEDSATGPVVTAISPGTIGSRYYFAEWGYDIGTHDALIAAKNAEIGQITIERNTARGERDDLQTQLGNKTRELADKTTEYNNLWTTYQELLGASVEGSEEWLALKAEYETQIAGFKDEIEDLGDLIGDYEEEIELYTKALADKTKELEDYIKEHEGDYDKGYNDGFLSYVDEYVFVTWKILQNNEDAAGALTTYALHEKVNTPYGTQITAPNAPVPTVQSKQYIYTFSHWSLTPQTGATKNAEATLSVTREATDVAYYAQYDRVVREYDINWVIPTILNGQLNYVDGNTITVSENKYGADISWALTAEVLESLSTIYDTANHVNYIFAGWYSSSSGGDNVTNFGTVTGERTFYARYTMQPTV